MTSARLALATVALSGVLAHAGPPEPRGTTADELRVSELRAAVADVKGGVPRACLKLSHVLWHYWDATDRLEWPRVMRRRTPAGIDWVAAARICGEQAIAAPPSEEEWTPTRLLNSPVLQDDGQRRRALARGVELGQIGREPDGGYSDYRARGGGESTVSAPPRARDCAEADPTVTGPLDPAQVKQIIRTNRGAIRRCYELELHDLGDGRAPATRGTVAVRFTLTAQGEPSDIRLTESTLANVDVEACVLERIEHWRFPRPKKRPIEIAYTFDFQPLP